MSTDSIQDSTRYLVDSLHFGSILPGNRAEMLRDVFLQKGADIKGGIYANELNITGGDIQVEGTVYCKSNVKFDISGKGAKDPIIFHSTVTCPGTILVPGRSGKTRFLSDIYCGKLNLKNCTVYGNIYASSATLEDCIVLGGVYCKKDLKMQNTIAFTFRAKHSKVEENVRLLSPFAFSDKIELSSRVQILTFNKLFTNSDQKEGGNIKLDETDIYEIELEKKEGAEDADAKKIQVLSVAERILSTSEIIEHFHTNRNFIEFLSLNSHLSEEDKRSFEDQGMGEIENQLWQIIEEKSEIKELEGAHSLEDLLNNFSGI